MEIMRTFWIRTHRWPLSGADSDPCHAFDWLDDPDVESRVGDVGVAQDGWTPCNPDEVTGAEARRIASVASIRGMHG